MNINIGQTLAGPEHFNYDRTARKHFPISVKTSEIVTRHGELTQTYEVNTSQDEDTPFWEPRTIVQRPDMIITTAVTTCMYNRGGIPTVRLYGAQGIIANRGGKNVSQE